MPLSPATARSAADPADPPLRRTACPASARAARTARAALCVPLLCLVRSLACAVARAVHFGVAAVGLTATVSTAGGRSRDESGNDGGQATAEYALVLLGAATIALLLVAWATGSGKIGALFDGVFDHLLEQVR